ncbi:hypothetical protein LSTR_LSTR000205 [Laodelphax striatellus]|uniref:Uncharacterized protein n=1 Tax=Laodelphax striatellus TaxID=195883 RepID=A0A482X848_LAOST|nr:hypothetical protein LSTR_LSTR000205 [Laodelphax striatellus]
MGGILLTSLPLSFPFFSASHTHTSARDTSSFALVFESLFSSLLTITECNLAPFQSGTSTQKIPFVFLPMKGQIVYPSAEISFTGVKSPICVVSGAKFLTRAGWADLRNRSDTEPPFRMFRDEGRTFLQWLGTQELRLSMEGRLLLVSLMCKDMGDTTAHSSIFTPCVAFRVAGTPSVREVSFSADAHVTESGSSGGLSASEFVAIAVCSVLLALMYIASVLLYLHTKRRHLKERRDGGDRGGDTQSAATSQLVVEEGVVKNNPLLMRHCHDNTGYVSDSHSCCSDTDNDACSDQMPPLSDDGNTAAACNSIQQIHTAAQIHPHATEIYASDCSAMQLQDSSAIERLPEENVSIVETLEMREDRPETVRAITTASTRRKLYFNPAYFEPEMLLAPPPAALEFLSKIREVIAIAKHKMAAKRFFPSLLGIPEEVDHQQLAQGRHSHHGSVRSSVKTSRHERGRFTALRTPTCEGCPGCGFESSYAEKECNDCCRTANESKQRSIRKWLEDVPLAAKPTKCDEEKEKIKVPPRRNYVNKGKAPAVPNAAETIPKAKPEPIDKSEIIHLNKIEPEIKKSEVVLSSFISPPIQNNKIEEIEKRENERNLIIKTIPEPSFVITPAIQNGIKNSVKKSLSKENFKSENKQKPSQKVANNDSHSEKSISPKAGQKIKHPSQPPPPPPPPPPSICSSIDTDKNSHLRKTDSPEPKVPKVARKLMDAVIKEFEVNRTSTIPKPSPPKRIDSLAVNQDDENLDSEPEYETDSLERTLQEIKNQNNGLSTPSDYGEVVPRLNSNTNVALPLDEELTMQNTIFNKKTGSTTMSKMKAKQEELDDHEYEVILLNPEKENGNSKLILPDILSRGEGYSLVSEVYVNDNFSYGSSSLPSNASSSSACSSLNDEHKISYAEEKPGHLTIQVEGTPTYKQEDSDSFEPDTLDRKPAKLKICEFREEHQNIDVQNELFTDSLERPPHISLRTNGSFRNNESGHWGNNQDFPSIFAANPLSKNFGSLREIFEARNKFNQLGGCNKSEGFSPPGSIHSLHSDTDCYSTLSWRRATPKILRPEARQARRQRLPSPDARPPRPPKLRQAQQYRNLPARPPPPRPDAIPPLPPRSIKPPLPPKNGPVRSIVQRSEGGGGGMANRPLPALPPLSSRGGGTRHQSRRAPPPADASGCSSLASSEYEPVNAAPYKPPLTEAARAMRDTTLKQHRALLLQSTTQRTEDSGYLSTDSNASDNRANSKHKHDTKREESLSETDDSLCDGASESGGESIATDSFFFGNATPKLSIATSIDSGLGVSAPTISDTDSNVSFITVLPNGFGSRQGGVVLVP